jgi:hypothetical protein
MKMRKSYLYGAAGGLLMGIGAGWLLISTVSEVPISWEKGAVLFVFGLFFSIYAIVKAE